MSEGTFCPFCDSERNMVSLKYNCNKKTRQWLYPKICNPCLKHCLMSIKPAYCYIPTRARQRWRLSLGMVRFDRLRLVWPHTVPFSWSWANRKVIAKLEGAYVLLNFSLRYGIAKKHCKNKTNKRSPKGLKWTNSLTCPVIRAYF